MNNHDRYQLCLQKANEIVARYRAEAEGCDPQNSWVAIGVGVAGAAVQVGAGAMQKKPSGGGGGGGSGGSKGGIPQIEFPKMPEYIPANFGAINYRPDGAVNQDVWAYQRSDADFVRRHPGVDQAEKDFEATVASDQKGDARFIPAMQMEAINSGLQGALGAFGHTGPVLARGGGAEADVAKNLGLSIMGFQDRNRQNANQSLSLAEQIFPRREFGLNGHDYANMEIGNLNAKNAWNQADYANRVDQIQFNAKIAAGNMATQQQTSNANAQAQAQMSSAQSGMYGQLAQTAIGAIGSGLGGYGASRPAVTAITAR